MKPVGTVFQAAEAAWAIMRGPGMVFVIWNVHGSWIVVKTS